jgi:hypothetical protein
VTEPRVEVAWRYTFCDLLTRAPLAILPVVDADLTEVIGGVGEGSGKIPLTAPGVLTGPVSPWRATRAGRTMCFAQRVVTVDYRVVAQPCLWAGIVWNAKPAGRALALSMATVESYWDWRLVAQSRTFAQVDDAAIQRTLIAEDDAEAVASGSLGIILGTSTVGTLSDRTVSAGDLDTVLEAVQSVAAGGGGFEWCIVPGVDAAGGFTLTLQQAPRLGRADPGAREWVAAPTGRPGNELLGHEEETAAVPNRLVGVGAGSGPDQLRSVVDASELGDDELADGWPLLERKVSGGGSDLITQEALDYHTLSQLDATRRNRSRITSMTVRGDRGSTVDTYGRGDAVTLNLLDPYRETPGRVAARILSRRILPPQPGRNELVTMDLEVVG